MVKDLHNQDSKSARLSQRGFTLIEIMTALSLFLIIMTISMGSILGVFDSNRRSRSMRAVMSNLNLAVESMSKEMRFGENYHCGTSGAITSPLDCPSGDTLVSFLSSNDEQIVYRLNGNAIEKSVDSGANYIEVTPSEVVIESFNVYVVGSTPADNFQPKALMKIKGYAGEGDNRSNFTLQTLVSQRKLDN